MYGREKLETYYKTSCVKDMDKFYGKDEADKVMDAMERRIARLTALVEGWKRNSVELSEMYHKRLDDVQNTMATENVDLGMDNFKLKKRIKELEDVKECQDRGITWLNERIKELEEALDNAVTGGKIALEQAKKFEATISKMETTTPLPPPPTTEEK